MEQSDLEDQLKREKIAKIEDVKTLYRPVRNIVMCIPLPDVKQVGSIIIPDRHPIPVNEGHIVAMGPDPDLHKYYGIGDCVTWGRNMETAMEIEGFKFVLIPEGGILMRISKEELEKKAAERIINEPQQSNEPVPKGGIN